MRNLPSIIKVGGSCLNDLSADWWDDLARYGRNHPLVLVHGWSEPLKRLDPRYGEPSAILRDRYGNQSRWTTPEVITDIKKVSEELGTQIADRLAERGLTTQRLLGSDGLLRAGEGERWWWRDKQLVQLDNLVGPIAGVDVGPFTDSVPGHCYLVTPLARNAADEEVNTDADRAAAAVAGALSATSLALVTNVPHLLIDGRPVRRITPEEASRFRDRAATGGMRKKLRAADEALQQGVGRVIIGSSPVSELLAEWNGTVITKE
ncbi:acetylglutamate kinase [Streptomonospora sp. PA3]|uniref:amino acid kinase family protein n=1 Tax=Streptomonospora sp. PA3 TaxID=2607326 RepID=UPI0012DCAFCB|nr:acetylglutamate kinase [Streptomonospora sp. PA3]MUL41069.1 acetylglutamate kinase [Streptomonospora sp. PA3]